MHGFASGADEVYYCCQTLVFSYLPPLNESNRSTAGLSCIKVRVELHQSEGCAAAETRFVLHIE